MRLSLTFPAGSLLLGLTLAAAPLEAAPILGSAGAGLYNVGGVQETNARFWDGNSWDSDSAPDGQFLANPCNAGHLASGGPCNLNYGGRWAAGASGNFEATARLANGSADLQDWRNADGSADMSFGFGNQGGEWFDFTMLGEYTADWNVNEIGWYDLDNPQVLHTIFGATAAIGSTARAFIPSNFGFYYLNTSGNGEVYFTQSQFNGQGAANQQFAAFQHGDYTILGVEDIFSRRLSAIPIGGASDYDYNDVLFGFRSAQVPEPSALLLVGMGLAGAFAARRRQTR